VLHFYVERDIHPEKWYPHGKAFDDLPAEYRENLNREPPFDRLVPALVERTLEAVSTRPDVSVDEEGRAAARLGLAVIRGLLLDLVATGDRKATDRALELYASLVADRVEARRIGSNTAPVKRTRRSRTRRK